MNHYQLNDLSVGMKESLSFTLDEAKLDAFRALTGDENPLHSDAAYAAACGFPQRVAYGMLTASYLSTLAGVLLPGERSLIHSAEIKFVAPVLMGDALTLTGEVVQRNEQFSFITVKFSVVNSAGKKVCRGEMQIGVR